MLSESATASVNRGGRPGPVRGTWTSPGRPAAVRSTVFAGPDVPETSPVLRRLGRCRAIPWTSAGRTTDGLLTSAVHCSRTAFRWEYDVCETELGHHRDGLVLQPQTPVCRHSDVSMTSAGHPCGILAVAAMLGKRWAMDDMRTSSGQQRDGRKPSLLHPWCILFGV